MIWGITNEVFNSETIHEFDILSTHYYVNETLIDNITINYIDDSLVDLLIRGYVGINRQYGSDGDLRRGDGVKFDESYPFKTSLKINVTTPLEMSILPEDIQVDNSKFYE